MRGLGLYLYDTAGTGFDTVASISGAPTLDVLRGTITGNQYGINFRQGNITPSDFAGKEVACYDNASTTDGCSRWLLRLRRGIELEVC